MKTELDKAILQAKRPFIKISGKERWARETLYLGPFMPIIKRCEVESVKQTILNIALTGITLNPIFNEAYLIERDGKCFLDFTYRGLIKIATSEGSITSLSAGVVYNWDEIEIEQGTNARLHYVQNLTPPKDPDEIARNPKLIWEFTKCAYSIARFPNGQEDFIILPKHKLLKTWQSIEKSPINELWPEEWIRKTAIRYHSKTLPHAQRLVTAVAVLNEHEGIAKKRKPQSRLMRRMKK